MSSLSHRGGLDRYAALFRGPSVRSVVAAGLVGRLPLGMLPLGNVLLLRHAGESYAVVGVVVAAVSIANGISSPLIGRLIDRLGLIRVLLPLAGLFPLSMVALVALAAAGAPAVALTLAGAAVGVTLPPLGACVARSGRRCCRRPSCARRRSRSRPRCRSSRSCSARCSSA